MTDLLSLSINELVAAFYESSGIVSTKYLVQKFSVEKFRAHGSLFLSRALES